MHLTLNEHDDDDDDDDEYSRRLTVNINNISHLFAMNLRVCKRYPDFRYH